MNQISENSVQKNMLYNTVGSLIYYFCQWVMTIILGRLSGFSDTGLLSLAMTVTSAPAIVSLFNIRSYQVSDLKNEFSDKTYLFSRIYTNIFSFILCFLMILGYQYNLKKASIILIYMFLKVVEGFVDVYYGIDQKNGRMDYIGISMSIRGIGGLACFILGIKLTGNLFLSILFTTIFYIIIVVLYDKNKSEKLMNNADSYSLKNSFSSIKNLLIICFPLAVFSIMNNLSISVPRIYLEKYYGENIMGIFSLVSSPAIIVQLAATTLFAPLIPIMAKHYQDNNRKKFLRILAIYSLSMVVASILFILGGMLLGKWGLVLLCGKKIIPYVNLFVPILVVSIIIAVNGCLGNICTLMRALKSQYIIGITGLLTSIILSLTIVKKMSMTGVILTLCISLIVQTILQLIIIISKIQKMK